MGSACVGLYLGASVVDSVRYLEILPVSRSVPASAVHHAGNKPYYCIVAHLIALTCMGLCMGPWYRPSRCKGMAVQPPARATFGSRASASKQPACWTPKTLSSHSTGQVVATNFVSHSCVCECARVCVRGEGSYFFMAPIPACMFGCVRLCVLGTLSLRVFVPLQTYTTRKLATWR